MRILIGIFLFFIMLALGVLSQDRLPEETMSNMAGSYIITTIAVVSLGSFIGERILEKMKGGK